MLVPVQEIFKSFVKFLVSINRPKWASADRARLLSWDMRAAHVPGPTTSASICLAVTYNCSKTNLDRAVEADMWARTSKTPVLIWLHRVVYYMSTVVLSTFEDSGPG